METINNAKQAIRDECKDNIRKKRIIAGETMIL